MEIFFTLLAKLIPLYFFIALGWIAGKVLHANQETVANLLIYIIGPVVIFYGVIQAEITPATISLPFLFFILCCGIALSFLWLGKWIWPNDPTKNLLALSAGSGNTGYFGLPVVLLLFAQEPGLQSSVFSLATLAILGFGLFEQTVGFFITAKGHHTVRESLRKIAKLPTAYAFLIGLLFHAMNSNLLSLERQETAVFIEQILGHFTGAYTVLGMMMIGMGLATVTRMALDFKFIGFAFLAKFLVWPGAIALLIFLDNAVFHFFNPTIHKVMILMSIVPLAANTVTIASALKVHPEKASMAVLLSTLFALFFIPLVVTLFLR